MVIYFKVKSRDNQAEFKDFTLDWCIYSSPQHDILRSAYEECLCIVKEVWQVCNDIQMQQGTSSSWDRRHCWMKWCSCFLGNPAKCTVRVSKLCDECVGSSLTVTSSICSVFKPTSRVQVIDDADVLINRKNSCLCLSSQRCRDVVTVSNIY